MSRISEPIAGILCYHDDAAPSGAPSSLEEDAPASILTKRSQIVQEIEGVSKLEVVKTEVRGARAATFAER